MIQVSKETFYKIIYDGKLDVISTSYGSYPYCTEFTFRDRRPFGKITRVLDGLVKVIETYEVVEAYKPKNV